MFNSKKSAPIKIISLFMCFDLLMPYTYSTYTHATHQENEINSKDTSNINNFTQNDTFKIRMISDNKAEILGYKGENIPEKLIIPDFLTESIQVTSIGDNAFFDTPIKSLIFKGSIEKIGKEAFRSCKHLEAVFFEKSIGEIDEYAFSGCNLLKTIKSNQVAKSICDNSFDPPDPTVKDPKENSDSIVKDPTENSDSIVKDPKENSDSIENIILNDNIDKLQDLINIGSLNINQKIGYMDGIHNKFNTLIGKSSLRYRSQFGKKGRHVYFHSSNRHYYYNKRFHENVTEKCSLITYAALCGSVKCFKFLLSNNAKLNDTKNQPEKFIALAAIFSRNLEIIHICENQGLLKECELLLPLLGESLYSPYNFPLNFLEWVLSRPSRSTYNKTNILNAIKSVRKLCKSNLAISADGNYYPIIDKNLRIRCKNIVATLRSLIK